MVIMMTVMMVVVILLVEWRNVQRHNIHSRRCHLHHPTVTTSTGASPHTSHHGRNTSPTSSETSTQPIRHNVQCHHFKVTGSPHTAKHVTTILCNVTTQHVTTATRSPQPRHIISHQCAESPLLQVHHQQPVTTTDSTKSPLHQTTNSVSTTLSTLRNTTHDFTTSSSPQAASHHH